MKRIIFILLLLFLDLPAKGQPKSIDCSNKTVKVKPVKTILYDSCKQNGDGKAYVLEYNVLRRQDQRKYGKKLYVITTCFDFPSDGVYEGNHEWDLEISECKFYLREFIIINEKLLEKNVKKKKYWNRNMKRKARLSSVAKAI